MLHSICYKCGSPIPIYREGDLCKDCMLALSDEDFGRYLDSSRGGWETEHPASGSVLDFDYDDISSPEEF